MWSFTFPFRPYLAFMFFSLSTTSSGDKVTIIFESDKSAEFSGFRISYKQDCKYLQVTFSNVSFGIWNLLSVTTYISYVNFLCSVRFG